MSCCHYYKLVEGCEQAFSVDSSAITFGPGVLGELGDHALAKGMTRVALFTDPGIVATGHLGSARDSLKRRGIDSEIFDEVSIEPTDASFIEASRFASEGGFDGYVSVGGCSVIDTCKAANLYVAHPADVIAYVNAPIGEGRPVPGPLLPHIACPTTSGTGSECTGIAVFDLLSLKSKTGIASRYLRPDVALIDPTVTSTLPATVVAASGFDVLSHALESYTALPYSCRPAAADARVRPMSQGANPWSDVGCEHALRLVGRYLQRAIDDACDGEARGQMMYAATLAGIAFGNAGVHVPHGMSYPVAGMVRDFRPEGYPGHQPLVPHGISVIVNAPAAFQYTAAACPQRHLYGAELLGANTAGALPEDSGEILAAHLLAMMKAANMPNGLEGVGYGETDVERLADGAILQQRLLQNAPCEIDHPQLRELYRGALRYW